MLIRYYSINKAHKKFHSNYGFTPLISIGENVDGVKSFKTHVGTKGQVAEV